MRVNIILQFFILLSTLLVIRLTSTTAQSPPLTTCVAGYFKTGHKANVTCHFYHFATDQKNGVHIMLRDFQNPQRFPENEVLKCTFTGDAVSVCEADDGYRFVSFDNNILTMEITKVSPKFEGSYTCGVTPPSGGEVYPCMLLVDSGTPKLVAEVENGNGNPVVYVNLILLLILLGMAVAMFTFAGYKMKWFSLSKLTSRSKKPEQTPADPESDSPEKEPLTTPETPASNKTPPSSNASSPNESIQQQQERSKSEPPIEVLGTEKDEGAKKLADEEHQQNKSTEKKSGSCVVQ